MKLLSSPTSPYARVVRAVIKEKSLDYEVNIIEVDPWANPNILVAANPFCRIPVLTTATGIELSESLVIALYLEKMYPDPTLLPPSHIEQVLHKVALGIGLIDSAVAIVAAKKFDSAAESNLIVQRRVAAIDRTLPTIFTAVEASTNNDVDLGDLYIAVSLEYIDLRFPNMTWRQTLPKLADWLESLVSRPALAETAPVVSHIS
jgi:glutathione S-transferase